MANGAWADERTNVLTVVQPEQLRFHASGLQSDLGVLRDGLEVTIVPPTPTSAGNAVPLDSTMRGTLILGLSGDAEERTIDLYVTPEELASWARPGVSAQLEIVTDATATPELAIPLAAVQRDGLLPIIFRRAPDNPNEAIRMDADLGRGRRTMGCRSSADSAMATRSSLMADFNSCSPQPVLFRRVGTSTPTAPTTRETTESCLKH